jgi:hypothetical protein
MDRNAVETIRKRRAVLTSWTRIKGTTKMLPSAVMNPRKETTFKGKQITKRGFLELVVVVQRV